MKRSVKITAVVLTGGAGTRIKNGNIPKQFLLVAGKPLFVHALYAYRRIKEVTDICLVVNAAHQKRYEKILKQHNIKKVRYLVPGGKTRIDSINNALNALKDSNYVVIHDGAYPLISAALIKECIKIGTKTGAVTAYKPLDLTPFRKVADKIDRFFDRDDVAMACCPQVFKTNILEKAIAQGALVERSYVSPIDLVRQQGYEVRLVKSGPENIKVTYNSDLKAVEYLLKNENHV